MFNAQSPRTVSRLSLLFVSFPLLMHSGGCLMSDEDMSRAELLGQLAILRRKVAELEDRQNLLVQAELALRESEEKYRAIVDNLSVGVFISTPGGAFLHANPAVAKIAGYKNVEEFLTVPTEQLYANKSDRGRVLDRLHREGSVSNAETQMRKKDGTFIWVSLSAVLKGNQDENSAWIVGIVQDISDRKAAEELLRESEERARVAFDTSPDAITISRAKDGVYIAVNEGFTSVSGYSDTEVRGKSSDELNIWNDSEDRKKLVRGLERDGYVKNLEVQFRLKDGSIRTGLLSARVITLQGEPHVLSITRDIEEWKRTKEMLQQTEKRYVRLVKNTDTGFVRLDASGCVIDANEPYARMAGAQSVEQVVGRSVLEWTAPEFLTESTAAIARCIAKGSVVDFETVYLRADGSRAHTF